MLSDEHHTVNEFHSVGPVKEKAPCPKVFVFVKGMRKVLVSEMEPTLSGWTVDMQSGVQKERLGNFR